MQMTFSVLDKIFFSVPVAPVVINFRQIFSLTQFGESIVVPKRLEYL
jgi:hypothetical protein